MNNHPDPLRIIQVSDCHLSSDPETPYRGQNADTNLTSLIDRMRSWRPDVLLATGDLSEDAGENSYARLAAILERVAAPVSVLPGNHDEAPVMRRYFPRGPWAGRPCIIDRPLWRLILLDSKKPGAIGGALEPAMLDGSAHALASSPAENKLVALHHQPVPVGAAWIDRYRLERAEQLFEILDADPGVRAVVWGHIHHAFEALRDGVRLLGTPSTVANALPGSDRFDLDRRGPACRWLELMPDGGIETGVLFTSD